MEAARLPVNFGRLAKVGLLVCLLVSAGCRTQLGSAYAIHSGKKSAEEILPPGAVDRTTPPAIAATTPAGVPTPVSQASFAPPPVAGASVDGAAAATPVAGPLPEPTRDQAFATILGDLQAIGAQNPAAQQELLAKLQTAKPAHWELMVKQFKATLAYHQQLKQEDAASAPDAVPSATHSSAGREPAAAIDLDGTSMGRSPSAEPLVPAPPVIQLASATTDVGPQMTANPHFDDPPGDGCDDLETCHGCASCQPQRWDELVQQASATLEAELPTEPTNVADAYQHARLRLLQLALGNLDAAVTPVPGLSASEQDYWSKQMFAIATLLDDTTQPESARRAAAATLHLQDAYAKLQQMSSLSVRNLTFCDEVMGYGAYKQRASRRFAPGEDVTIYVEVENYQSNQTDEGRRTVVGTSYQIFNKHGDRVDGREFPVIDDYCLSPRRDFHIQYGVTLPERVYPGEYRMELTLTDQLGGKIGRSSIDFEIVEGPRN